ncbi:unnamed protein product [Rotaria sp. Silwood1]|nr:unnamed protein product [Rotaria sp. Silwood1]
MDKWFRRGFVGLVLIIEDYGQIHFTQNERKSWYIRYPFNPPNAVQLATSKEIRQQTIRTEANEEEDNQSSFHAIEKLPASHSIIPIGSVPREPAKHLLELLRDKWELSPPELIISVVGGAKIFNLAERSRAILQKGLVSAAVTTGKNQDLYCILLYFETDAWVFTGGTYAGVMKDVGDAFEKWTYKSSSMDKTHTRVPVIGIASWYYTTNYKQLIQKRSSESNSKRNSTSVSMDDIEINREKLYRNGVPQDNPQSYPLDPNHTHFILLDDRCGAGDEKWRKKRYSVRVDLTIQLRAEIEREARYSSHYRQNYNTPIIQILIGGGRSSLLTVIEAVTHETPVIVVEVRAQLAIMFKQEESNVYVQKLKLAMAWKKFDLAMSEIFNKNNKISWTDAQLDSALVHAIRYDSVQFVELLIEQGASFDRLRRLINLNDLYKKKSGLPLLDEEIVHTDNNKQQMYYKQYLDTEALKTIESLEGNGALHLSSIDMYGTIENPLKLTTNLNGFAVFNGDDVNTIVAALVASKIYKKAAEMTESKEQKREYIAKKKDFDVHAAQIIDKCFSQDEYLALELLTTQSKLYFGYTPIELAEETNSRTFLASECVQAYADQLWYGDIEQPAHRKNIVNILVGDV